jgi:hydroxymethylglutaryl-CoA synthase
MLSWPGVPGEGNWTLFRRPPAALEEAKPGDKILVASYGNGADILLLKVTENIGKTQGRRSIAHSLARKMIIPDYETYAGFRHSPPEDNYYPPARPSTSAIWRDRVSARIPL